MYGIGSWKNWLNIHITEAAMTLEQASAKAKEESRNGYVQHVCRRVESLTPYVVFYIVSDWYDSSTVVSFECGREL
jgi:hypothetical protein